MKSIFSTTHMHACIPHHAELSKRAPFVGSPHSLSSPCPSPSSELCAPAGFRKITRARTQSAAIRSPFSTHLHFRLSELPQTSFSCLKPSTPREFLQCKHGCEIQGFSLSPSQYPSLPLHLHSLFRWFPRFLSGGVLVLAAAPLRCSVLRPGRS